MAEKVFKDGKLVVIKSGRTIHDLKKGQMNDPLSHKEEKPAEESAPVKHSYISAGRNNEPLTDDIKAKIEKLRDEGTTESMISLIQLFSHPKWAARKLASDIMVGFGEKTVPIISQTVFLSQSSLDEDSLYWSIRTLGTIGVLATPALVTVLNSVVLPKSYKVFVVRAMESCKTKEGIAALINCFNDESWLIRREAGNVLIKMGELVVPHLKASFSSGNEDIRYWSVKILGGILGKGAIDYFKKMLKSDKRDMRYFATAALGEIGDDEALDSLAETFSDDSWLVRAQVAEILEKKGKAAVKVLKKVLETGSSDAKFMAIKLMSKILGKDAVNYISKIVSTADTDLKFFGLSALAETMDESVIPTLVNALGDSVWLVRKHASALLEKFGAKVIDKLLEILSASRDENLRYWVIITLCNIGKPALHEIKDFLAASDKKEKLTLIQSLKSETVCEMLPELFTCFADRQWPVRNEAYKKLCEMSDCILPAIFEYQNHANSDIRYWTSQIIKNNQQVISKMILRTLKTPDASKSPEAAATCHQNAISLLLNMTQPDVVSDMIEFAIANTDDKLLLKLASPEFFESLLGIYTGSEFESKSQKAKNFIVGTLKDSAENNINAIRNYLKNPDCDREKIMKVLAGVNSSIAGDVFASFLNDSDPRVRMISLQNLMKNCSDNEALFGPVIEAFKAEDEAGRLNFISGMPSVKSEKMLRALSNQFKACNELDCTWIARLMVEWGNQSVEYLKGIMDSTSDSKVRHWIEKVINHIKGVEFL